MEKLRAEKGHLTFVDVEKAQRKKYLANPDVFKNQREE